MQKLENVEKLMALLHKVQNVKRVARIPDEKTYRNTAEHTFELVMLCWYVMVTDELNLDTEKVFSYALAHDVVEAYAGDSYIYDEEAKKTKHEREAKALERIEKEFPEFSTFVNVVKTYEKQEDEESRFVYALDKLVDPLNISMETTQSLWKEHDVSYVQLREYKDTKIEKHEHVALYWKQILSKLEQKKDFYFHS